MLQKEYLVQLINKILISFIIKMNKSIYCSFNAEQFHLFKILNFKVVIRN